MHSPLKKNGFSLLEIMIALSIGLVLIGTSLMIFLQTKASYHVVHALENIQDNGRFAYVFLSHAVQKAENVQAYSKDHLPVNFQKQVLTDTDVLFVQHQQDRKVYFIGDTHRFNARGQPIYALYEKKWKPSAETMRRELVPGMDSMHIYLKDRKLTINLYLNSIDALSSGILPFMDAQNNTSFFATDLRLHRKWPLHLALTHFKKVKVALN